MSQFTNQSINPSQPQSPPSTFLTFLLPEHLPQILHGLIHPPPHLRAGRLLIVIIPGINQHVLVLFADPQILVLVKREKVLLVELVVKDDLSLGSRGCVILLGTGCREFLDRGLVAGGILWWV